jgi:formyltetrahydrofolate synthetase
MLPIADVAARLGLTTDLLEPYGQAIAKIRLEALDRFPKSPPLRRRRAVKGRRSIRSA